MVKFLIIKLLELCAVQLQSAPDGTPFPCRTIYAQLQMISTCASSSIVPPLISNFTGIAISGELNIYFVNLKVAYESLAKFLLARCCST